MVVLKTGKTDDGVRAARSHTASLAGSYDAFAAVCRAHGVVLVDDPVTMVRVADLLLRCRRHDCAMASASCRDPAAAPASWWIALSVPACASRVCCHTTRAALGELLLPPQADNPVDLGGRLPTQSDDIAAPVVRALAADPDVGVMLLYLTSMPLSRRARERWCKPRWPAASRCWR